MSLKEIPAFAALTPPEASVFDRLLLERRFAAGERIPPDDSLLVVRQGAVRLWVEGPRGRLGCGGLKSGGIVGELGLFEPDPVSLEGEAELETSGYGLRREALKSAFRYSRSGAVKFMTVFARALSSKLRATNELLNQALAAGPPPDGSEGPRPARLGDLDLQRLKGLCVSQSFPAGAAIFREGDPSSELFVIGSGEVEIRKTTAPDKTVRLARLGPGDFFGEMAFVDQQPRSASAVAVTPVEASVLPGDALERVIEYNLGTALYLGSVICKIAARRLNVTLRAILSLSKA